MLFGFVTTLKVHGGVLKSKIFGSFFYMWVIVFSSLDGFQMENFAFICWGIWHRQNCLLHGEFVKSDKCLVDSLVEHHMAFLKANVHVCPMIQQRRVVNWSFPSSGFYKINVDGAVVSDSG